MSRPDRYEVRSQNQRRRYDAAAADALPRIGRLAGEVTDAAAQLLAELAQLVSDTSMHYASERLGLSHKELRVILARCYATPSQAETIAARLNPAEPDL